MGEQDGCADAGELLQDLVHVVFAAPGVAESGNVEQAAFAIEGDSLVLEDLDVAIAEDFGDEFGVGAFVMVAEDCDDAVGGTQGGEAFEGGGIFFGVFGDVVSG